MTHRNSRRAGLLAGALVVSGGVLAVAASASSPAAGSPAAGGDETAAVAAQTVRSQQAVDAVAGRIDAVAPVARSSGLSALYVYPQQRALTVWWAGKVPGALVKLARSRPDGVAVTILPGRYTQMVLQAASGAFNAKARHASAAALGGYEVVGVTPATDGSGLVVYAKNVSTSAAGSRAVGSRANVAGTSVSAAAVHSVQALATTVPVVQVQASSGATLTASRVADIAPWYGGSRFYNTDNGMVCTRGPAVTVVPSNAVRQLTAAHCGKGEFTNAVNNTVWSPGPDYENVASAASQIDSMVVNPSGGAAGYIYTGPWNSSASTNVAGQLIVQAGDNVCSDGASSGDHCTLIARSEGQWDVPEAPGGVVEAWEADNPGVGMAVAGGDSGGPVYSPRSDGSVDIRGIVDGAADGSGVTCPVGAINPDVYHPACYHELLFIDIYNIHHYWNVNVITQ